MLQLQDPRSRQTGCAQRGQSEAIDDRPWLHAGHEISPGVRIKIQLPVSSVSAAKAIAARSLARRLKADAVDIATLRSRLLRQRDNRVHEESMH